MIMSKAQYRYFAKVAAGEITNPNVTPADAARKIAAVSYRDFTDLPEKLPYRSQGEKRRERRTQNQIRLF